MDNYKRRLLSVHSPSTNTFLIRSTNVPHLLLQTHPPSANTSIFSKHVHLQQIHPSPANTSTFRKHISTSFNRASIYIQNALKASCFRSHKVNDLLPTCSRSSSCPDLRPSCLDTRHEASRPAVRDRRNICQRARKSSKLSNHEI